MLGYVKLTKYNTQPIWRKGMLKHLEKLRDLHEERLFSIQKSLRLDDYHMMWIAFGKGVLVGMFLLWIF